MKVLAKEPLTNEVISRLIAGDDLAAIRDARDDLMQAKFRIEAELAQSRGQMEQVRSDLLRSGEDPRMAQLTATGTTDRAWRGSTVAAVKRIDAKLSRLKARLRQDVPQAKSSATGKLVPLRHVVVMEGAAEEIAENLRSWIDDGWSQVGSLVLRPLGPAGEPAVVLLTVRKDYE